MNLSKYLDSRAAELGHFQHLLARKKGSITKTPMQRVPKHLRRRAMAHNRYRIPSRIREIAMLKSGVSESKKLRCRKHLRNSRLLMIHYFRRHLRKGNWLETHLWHAKRMKMVDYHGYKIASNSSTKCYKAAYRLAKFKSTLYDKSYYKTILVDLGVRFGNTSLEECKRLLLLGISTKISTSKFLEKSLKNFFEQK